jgi:hypothetical protein
LQSELSDGLTEAGFYIEVAGRACKHCRLRKDDVVKLRSIIEAYLWITTIGMTVRNLGKRKISREKKRERDGKKNRDIGTWQLMKITYILAESRIRR